MRIGIGYDAHRLTEGRPLILGGVAVPHPRGLAGHSDADVLVHAVCDAVLGALGMGDIGRHFPDTDPALKDIPSLKILHRVERMAGEHGFRCINVDAVIIAQEPRLAGHTAAMQANIAECLHIDAGQVNVKATTTEGLGFEGAREGISAQAVVLMEKV